MLVLVVNYLPSHAALIRATMWETAALRAPRPVEELSITGFSGDVASKYKVDTKVVGEGHYGTVRKCQDIETGIW